MSHIEERGMNNLFFFLVFMRGSSLFLLINFSRRLVPVDHVSKYQKNMSYYKILIPPKVNQEIVLGILIGTTTIHGCH